MDFSQFEKDYKNFYAPNFKLLVGNIDLARKGMEIVSVTVDNTLDAADQANFTISHAFDVKKREVRWFDQEIAVGKEVEIKMGYCDKLEPMFIGTITSVKVTFPSGGMSQLEVTAFDLSHPMTKNKKSWSWDNKKDSDIATELANAYHLKPIVDDTRSNAKPEHIRQDNQSDFDFLKKRAEENQFEFFVFGRELHFRLPVYEESAVVKLEWGKTLMSFSPEIDIADQVQDVEVRGWDPKRKREIIGRARSGEEAGRDRGRRSGSEMLRSATGERIVERVRRPVKSLEEANKLAKSILTKIAEGLVKGSGECLGLPELRAGKNVSLEGLGSKFSKSYYVEKTNHNISSSGYRTTFNVKETTI